MNPLRQATAILCLFLLTTSHAVGCEEDQVLTCHRPDGVAGTRVCLHGRWTSCGGPGGPHAVHLVDDANDPAAILRDADKFQTLYFGDSDDNAVASLNNGFTPRGTPPYWDVGQQTSALVQIYDL